MTVTRRAALQTLAEQAASKIGFTLRRWWQDATNPSVLRVEVERRMIGAPPAVGELKVVVPDLPSQRQKQPPSVTTRPRKLRRRQAVSSLRKQTARPQKRKASATATKESPRTQQKTAKSQAPRRRRSSVRAAAGTRRTSARKRQK